MTHVLKKFAVIMLIAVLGPLGALNALAASSLSDIKVSNAQREATVSVSFNGPPDYAFFPLHGPERVVLDVNQKGKVGGLPLNFSGQNLVKSIRSSAPKDAQSVRLVFDLTQRAKTRVATRQNGGVHTVVFTITAEGSANTVVRKAPVAVNPPPRQAPVTVSQHHHVHWPQAGFADRAGARLGRATSSEYARLIGLAGEATGADSAAYRRGVAALAASAAPLRP